MFSQNTVEAIGFYVYILVDPRDSRTFYVGKGMGQRVFSHIQDAQSDRIFDSSEKIEIIRDIFKSGNEPTVRIVCHGVSEDQAFLVERALIDVLGLTDLSNKVSGHGSLGRGLMSADELDAMLNQGKADINFPCILIRINKLFRFGLAAPELYECTRKAWRVGKRRERARYALSVAFGVVREVYEIDQWTKAELGRQGEDLRESGRWEFHGRVCNDAQIRTCVGKSVSHLMSKGAQNPITYVKC